MNAIPYFSAAIALVASAPAWDLAQDAGETRYGAGPLPRWEYAQAADGVTTAQEAPTNPTVRDGALDPHEATRDPASTAAPGATPVTPSPGTEVPVTPAQPDPPETEGVRPSASGSPEIPNSGEKVVPPAGQFNERPGADPSSSPIPSPSPIPTRTPGPAPSASPGTSPSASPSPMVP